LVTEATGAAERAPGFSATPLPRESKRFALNPYHPPDQRAGSGLSGPRVFRIFSHPWDVSSYIYARRGGWWRRKLSQFWQHYTCRDFLYLQM